MFEHRRSGAEPGLTEDSPAITTATTARPIRPDPRERLLGAMIQTVAARGYEYTTVNRVLSNAGVPEAVFSEHFRDKHDCFMQALDELIGRVEGSALACFEEPLPWPERVRGGLEVLLCALAACPQAGEVVFVEALSAGPAACGRCRQALSLFASLVEEGRLLCVDGGHLPEQTSEAIVGGIASIVHRRALQGNLAELPSLHADLTYFVLLPYLEHERAADIAGLP